MSMQAHMYNNRQAPKIPPGGEVNYPEFYSDPRDDKAFFRATKQFQSLHRLKADGYFGINTMTEFLRAYTPVPIMDPAERGNREFSRRVWVGWGHVKEHEVEWLSSLGVDTVILNINKAATSQKWVWERKPAYLAKQVYLFHKHNIRVLLMPWMWRTRAFNRIAAQHTLTLAAECMADGVQFDVEGSWVFSGKVQGRSNDGTVKEVWRPFWVNDAMDHKGLTREYGIDGKFKGMKLNGNPFVYETTPLYFLRGAVDALNDEPEITVVSPQTYSQYDTRDRKNAQATRLTWFRAPQLQKRTLKSYLPLRDKGKFEKLILGIGGWWQDNPNQTVYEAMHAAMHEAYKGGADGVSLWGLHTIQPDFHPPWRREREHREAFEKVMGQLGQLMESSA